MKGLGIMFQIGRTTFYVRSWPFEWSVNTSLMSPRQFGLGAWITKDPWC